ncbi:kinase-like domain-containing protein [Pelagophyceae sp. CCMP2097]|nr:kinase-like domain-containing protein [Pelagophyceae sp. CCMP2097]
MSAMERQYDVGGEVGRGQWGVVYSATRRRDATRVAIKRVRCAASVIEGVNFQVLREIKMLRGVEHENVIKLYDVLNDSKTTDGGIDILLVFELMATDLEHVIHAKRPIGDAEAKSYAQMLLRGLDFLHSHFVLHRDIKPANLLIGHSGVLKLADFGYARALAESHYAMSYQCCTLWYRPPELLLGAADYSARVDSWSAGCVIAEVSTRLPLFPGDSEIDQLAKIFDVQGTPSEKNWPGVEALRKYARFSETSGSTLRARLDSASTDLVSLCDSLLKCDPNKRAFAAEALELPYFSNEPRPALRPPAN